MTPETVALHPIEQTLARLAGANEHFRLRLLSECDAEPGWISLTDLLTPGRPELAEVFERVVTHFKIEDKQAPAALWLNHYAFAVAAVAEACYLAARRVPSLAIKDVWIRFADDGDIAAFAWRGRTFAALPTDPDATHPDCVLMDSEEAFRAYLHEQLIAHFTPLIDAIRERSTFGKPGMWSIVADQTSAAFGWIGDVMGARDTGLAEARAMAATPTRLKRRRDFLLIEHCGLDHLMAERSSCCLYYKAGDAQYCSNCPHRPQEERITLIKNYLERKASGVPDEHDHDHDDEHEH